MHTLQKLWITKHGTASESLFAFNPKNKIGQLWLSRIANPRQPLEYIIELTARNGLKSDTKTVTIIVE